MSMFRHLFRVATVGTVALMVVTSWSVAQEARHRPAPRPHSAASRENPHGVTGTANPSATARASKSSALSPARSPKEHHLVLQVNTNDAAAMNLALNNAMNVTQYYREIGDKVAVEIVTFGPGLHMLRNDTSPVKDRIEAMALSTPEVSFKACGNTQQNMSKAENKEIPIIPQAEVVKSGVVHVMELQERGWTYVKP